MRNNHKNNYCVILAGGKGRRLWPWSREQYPKQFIDFFGCGRTQLQQTFDRFSKIVPHENIYVNTNINYAGIVKEQLPELPEQNIMAEPIHRNTAPSAAWTTHRILHTNPEASIVITPSDQIVQNEEMFAKNINEGLDFVSTHDCILTMGVKPTRPEPGYGYIQAGEPVGNDVFMVQSFTEKPEREFAKIFMESGEFYWNTGLFFANARYGFKRFGEILPHVLTSFDEQHPDFTVEDEQNFIRENFPSYPNLSLDYGFWSRPTMWL